MNPIDMAVVMLGAGLDSLGWIVLPLAMLATTVIVLLVVLIPRGSR